MADVDQYYVALDDQVFGPYSLNEVSELGLTEDTLVCHLDSEWVNASEIPELQHLFRFDSQPNGAYRHRALYDNNELIYHQKRKAALICVLTLGLAGLSVVGVGETWRSNIFAGTSFDKGGLGFGMKILSFMIVSAMTAIPFFVISLVQLIYYSIKIALLNE